LTTKGRGVKRDGSQCTITVNPPQTYCWWHDPANPKGDGKQPPGAARLALQREQGAARAARGLTERVVAGKLEASRGAVANHLIGTRIRSWSTSGGSKKPKSLRHGLTRLKRHFLREESVDGTA
jgi:hypothetical protein